MHREAMTELLSEEEIKEDWDAFVRDYEAWLEEREREFMGSVSCGESRT